MVFRDKSDTDALSLLSHPLQQIYTAVRSTTTQYNILSSYVHKYRYGNHLK